MRKGVDENCSSTSAVKGHMQNACPGICKLSCCCLSHQPACHSYRQRQRALFCLLALKDRAGGIIIIIIIIIIKTLSSSMS